MLVDEVVVFASAWFDRPMTARGVDMSWPDVGFYLDGSWSAAVLVCSPGFRPPFAQRSKGQFVVYPWPDLGAPRDPRWFARALRWLLGQATEGRRVEIGCAGGHGRRLRVTLVGNVPVDNQMFSVGNAFRAQLVDVFVDETTIQVWHKNHLIKTVARTRSGRVRKVRADGLHVKHQPDTNRQASGGT